MIPKARMGRKPKYPFGDIVLDKHIDIKGERNKIGPAALSYGKRHGMKFVTRTGLPDLKKGYVRVYRIK